MSTLFIEVNCVGSNTRLAASWKQLGVCGVHKLQHTGLQARPVQGTVPDGALPVQTTWPHPHLMHRQATPLAKRCADETKQGNVCMLSRQNNGNLDHSMACCTCMQLSIGGNPVGVWKRCSPHMFDYPVLAAIAQLQCSSVAFHWHGLTPQYAAQVTEEHMTGSNMQASSGLAEDQAVQLVNALQHLEQVVVTGESLCRFAPVH